MLLFRLYCSYIFQGYLLTSAQGPNTFTCMQGPWQSDCNLLSQSHLPLLFPDFMNNLICLCLLAPMSQSRLFHAPQWPSSSSMPHVFLSPKCKISTYSFKTQLRYDLCMLQQLLITALIGITILSDLCIVFSHENVSSSMERILFFNFVSQMLSTVLAISHIYEAV